MSFQILKGWPSEGALDCNFAVTPGDAVTPGMVVVVETSMTVGLVAATTGGTVTPAFVIDVDPVTGKVSGLLSRAVIELAEADHFETGVYAIGDLLSWAVAGTLEAVGTTEQVCAKIIGINATTGTITIVWLP